MNGSGSDQILKPGYAFYTWIRNPVSNTMLRWFISSGAVITASKKNVSYRPDVDVNKCVEVIVLPCFASRTRMVFL